MVYLYSAYNLLNLLNYIWNSLYTNALEYQIIAYIIPHIRVVILMEVVL